MREMPKDERPYEKCARLGADSLSDVELLAVLLRTGTQGENAVDLARRVLYHAGENGILGIHQFNVERLKKIKGIGQVKAIQISCISELAKRPKLHMKKPYVLPNRKRLHNIIWKI